MGAFPAPLGVFASSFLGSTTSNHPAPLQFHPRVTSHAALLRLTPSHAALLLAALPLARLAEVAEGALLLNDPPTRDVTGADGADRAGSKRMN